MSRLSDALNPERLASLTGLLSTKDCWRYERDYACASSGVSNSCQTLEAASGCTAVGDPVCIKEDETGCAQWQKNLPLRQHRPYRRT